MRTPLLLFVCSLVAVACNPDPVLSNNTRPDVPVSTDAPVSLDAANPADATVDPDAPAGDVPIAPTPCRSSRDCARGVCDRLTGRCAECVSGAQCSAAAPLCQGNRCVAGTPCTSSRMCPAQVCATALGRCADCVTDPDCADGRVCVRNSCVPAPTPCMSSRQCGALDQVCDPARGVCFDCVADPDCPDGQFCSADRTCVPRLCVPAARECLDLGRLRVCNANGSAWQESPCGAGASCVDGRCQAQLCTPGAASCESMTQRRVCNPDGLGYAATACAAMESCSLGTCRAWSCTPGATTCMTSTSVSVCNADGLGTRAMSCPGASSCTGGRCSAWVCTPGTFDCGPDGARRGCSADGLGYATAPCTLPAHATATTCSAGTCGFTCESGWGDCDGAPSNGCETNLATAATSCGSCGRTCGAAAGSSSTCVAGACQLTCLGNYRDCDGAPGNGCEVFTATDVRHCGGCGTVCPARPNSVPTCGAGVCGSVCLSGYGDCDGDPANGCERALNTDAAHCGRCNNACATGPNAQVSCSAGACTFGCNAGFSDCDASRATGCEAVTTADLANCGGCGVRCAPANATGACVASACTLAACAAGFGDCDGAAGNGCEVTLGGDVRHCGACGTVCPGAGAVGTTVTCTAGACASTCQGGYANCDGSAANGCEANLAVDARNCGACGTVCPSGQACVAQACSAAPPGALTTARNAFGSGVALDGRVYVFGGYNGTYLSSTEMFDPATNAWTARASLSVGTWGPASATLADGRILAISGSTATAVTTAVWAYSPTANTWGALASVAGGRYHATATRGADGRVYLFGGRTGASMVTTAEVYNPTSNAWSAIRAPVTARVGASAVAVPDGRIYLFGGATDVLGTVPTTSVEIYDPTTNTWTAGPALTTTRAFSGSTLGTDGRIYLAGGYTGTSYQTTATTLVPSATAYVSIDTMSVPHGYFRLAALLDGRVLAIAGTNTTTAYLTRVEAYTPSVNLWR